MKKVFAIASLASVLALAACGSVEVEEEKENSVPDIEVRTIDKGDLYDFSSSMDVDISDADDSTSEYLVFNSNEAKMVLYGSSSCPPDPSVLIEEVSDDGEISKMLFELKEYGEDTVCTADYSPVDYGFEVPQDYEMSPDMEVDLIFPYSPEPRELWVFYGE